MQSMRTYGDIPLWQRPSRNVLSLVGVADILAAMHELDWMESIKDRL